MSPHPRLSIIIPHLNEPDMLARCLRSLNAQRSSGIPFEIIVVDNGSNEMPHSVCQVIPDVTLDREVVPGPGPARNRGAAIAKADLLAFIDADCVAAPGWVSAITSFLDSHPDVAFLGGDIGILPADPARLTAIEAYECIFSYRNRLYVEQHGFAATGNMAVRADVFRAVGPFGGISTMEDTEWGQRATSQGYQVAFADEAKVLTPSCKSFPELKRRWDRHISHEFRKVGRHPAGILSWLLGTAMVAASPPISAFAIFRSRRLVGFRSHCLACICLTRVRLYRAQRMLSLAFHDNTAAVVGSWNREKS
jgi:GT2 family glycosyltransferase